MTILPKDDGRMQKRGEELVMSRQNDQVYSLIICCRTRLFKFCSMSMLNREAM